jgi:hypothetical protein
MLEKNRKYLLDPPGDYDNNYNKEEPGGKTHQVGPNTWEVRD